MKFRHVYPLFLMVAIAAFGRLGAEPVRTYENSFLLLHLDHHAKEPDAIGRAADPVATEEAINLLKPDLIQIHAKGRFGWTNYPSKIGFVSPNFVRDVQQVWHDIARQDDYLYWIYYNIGRDDEIMHRRPEWNRVDAEGKARDSMLCYHTGVLDGYLWPMIDELMEMYHPDGLWFDGSVFTINTCYCATCEARFRETQGLPLPRTPDEAGWDDFKEMHRQIYRDFIREVYTRIKAKDAACSVVFNAGYSLMMPEEPVYADYLTHDIANEAERVSSEAHFLDGQRRPFDMMTSVWLGNDIEFKPKPRAQLEQEMAIIIANGGRFFAWDNPTRDSGLDRGRFEFSAEVVAPFLRSRQAWCLGTTRVPDVALFYGAADLYARTRESERAFPHAADPIITASNTLDGLHVNYEFVTDFRLETSAFSAPVLVLENVQGMSPRSLAALTSFVTRGGVILQAGATHLQPELQELLGIGLSAAGAPVVESAEVLIAGEDGRPALTAHAVGNGTAYFTPETFQGLPEDARLRWFGQVIARVLPPEARILNVAGLPATAEIGLRRGPQGTIVHLVNRSPGEREQVLSGGRSELSRRITGLPEMPACVVTLRRAEAPRSVTLQPQGTAVAGWAFADGRVTIPVPAFAIHQMVVIED